MINFINVENFKALKDAALKTTNLNIYTGINGMGKSSFIQILLTLRQSYIQNSLKNGLALNGEYIEIGNGKDALSISSNKDDLIKFEITWEDLSKGIFHFKYNADSDLLANQDIKLTDYVLTKALFTKKFQYLSAERIGPRTFYKSSGYQVREKKELGNLGEFSIYFLALNQSLEIYNEIILHPKAKSNTLISQVDAWLGEITLGTRLSTELLNDADLVSLAYQFESGKDVTSKFRPTNVGFGLTYVLPIIISILIAEKDSILIVENPESHLHPKGQAKIGELLALAASSGIQVFVETHSDHIINGTRVAVNQQKIPNDKVGIFYFERNINSIGHESKITQIMIDKHGELSEYPNGFMDEWSNQLFKLI